MKLYPRFIATCIATWLVGLASSTLAQVSEIRVLDQKGQGVPNVVVYITAPDAPVRPLQKAHVVDQVDQAFAPHISIMPVGSQAVFLNSDPVAHHVYSFSRPNDFVLPLFKGEVPEPVTLAHAGYVTMGCNIHDDMVGYIAVVESNSYGLTDADGRITLPMPQGIQFADARIRIWSPRLRERAVALVKPVTTTPVVFQLQKKLKRAHRSVQGKALWNNY